MACGERKTNRAKRGASAAAVRAARDEMRNRKATTSQVAAAAAPTGKAAASRVPKKVETPLPPRNRRKTGKR